MVFGLGLASMAMAEPMAEPVAEGGARKKRYKRS
jgi:hypothetical protein